MRYTQYLKLEKAIAASDTGGILERWRYGRRLLMDSKKTTPAGNLRHGALAELLGIAAKCGVKLSEREIRYRLQCAKTYETEAEIGTARADFSDWTALREAGFPQVEVADPGEPHDPRNDDEKGRDARDAIKRRKAQNPAQAPLFDWNPPHQFRGDEHGPRSTIKELYAVCDESERYTEGMIAYDARRRAYVDECAAAVDGDQDKTWYEAEQRRKGLDALGLTDWDSFTEIMEDFFSLHDSDSAAPEDDGDGEDDE